MSDTGETALSLARVSSAVNAANRGEQRPSIADAVALACKAQADLLGRELTDAEHGCIRQGFHGGLLYAAEREQGDDAGTLALPRGNVREPQHSAGRVRPDCAAAMCGLVECNGAKTGIGCYIWPSRAPVPGVYTPEQATGTLRPTYAQHWRQDREPLQEPGRG